MVVEVAGIAITTDSITTAIELALEASRRGLVKRSTTSEASTTMPSPTVAQTPWEQLIAYVTRPERHRQLALLHTLKVQGRKYISRDELVSALGLNPVGGANKLGGVLTGVLKQANVVGLNAEKVVERSTLGYRAGPLLLSHELPEVTPAM
jgi:hypothetical protein